MSHEMSPTLSILAETTIKGREVCIYRHANGERVHYTVSVNDVDKHGVCSAEDVIRALAHYSHTEPPIIAP